MRWRCKILTACVLMVSCLGAPARGAELGQGVAKALECGVSPVVVAEVESSVAAGGLVDGEAALLLAVLEATCEEGLPLGPFEDKLLEGLAKRVPARSILSVLGRKLAYYRQAEAMLRGLGDVAYLDAASVMAAGEGLAEGVSPGAYQAYFAAYREQGAEPFKLGLEMFSLLSRSGFGQKLSRQVLDAGFAAQTLTPQWRYFVQVVLVARKRGIADSETAAAAAEVLAAGGGLGEVSARLGFTHRDLSGRALQD